MSSVSSSVGSSSNVSSRSTSSSNLTSTRTLSTKIGKKWPEGAMRTHPSPQSMPSTLSPHLVRSATASCRRLLRRCCTPAVVALSWELSKTKTASWARTSAVSSSVASEEPASEPSNSSRTEARAVKEEVRDDSRRASASLSARGLSPSLGGEPPPPPSSVRSGASLYLQPLLVAATRLGGSRACSARRLRMLWDSPRPSQHFVPGINNSRSSATTTMPSNTIKFMFGFPPASADSVCVASSASPGRPTGVTSTAPVATSLKIRSARTAACTARPTAEAEPKDQSKLSALPSGGTTTMRARTDPSEKSTERSSAVNPWPSARASAALVLRARCRSRDESAASRL
mmetsp:Transcript_46597/g.132430  ORF Transcript_46597/g.132430 Transcript_46597/m.132430 type:complete len:344 (+) Transcript_46597:301-1332(+)